MVKQKRMLKTTDRKLFNEVKFLIEQTRQNVAQSVNRSLTLLNWNIGRTIHHHVLKGARAAYGQEIIATLSQQLTLEYGQGYNYSALTRMLKFYENFQDEKILATLSQHLSWSHFVELIPLDKEEQRLFYAMMAIHERWGVRLLRKRIDSMLFERTALSKRPEKLIRQELIKLLPGSIENPDLIFRDPYLLDFLGLKETYSERDLEDAILT